MYRFLLLAMAQLLACGVNDPATDGVETTGESSSTGAPTSGTTAAGPGSTSADAGSNSGSEAAATTDEADTSDTGPASSTMTDGGTEGETEAPDLGSRCEVAADWIACTRELTTVRGKDVFWQLPVGDPPPQGWPTVVLYHGSFFGPEGTWAGDPSLPFGGFEQLRLQAMLLDHGFALITPTASADLAWSTNFPNYLGSADHELVLALLDGIAAGDFGPLDTQRLYATGISSGGYMTSRMAVTYPGTFRALAVHSGSYATCTNVLCLVPDPLPADHAATLFVHGRLDVVAPLIAMQAYADQLERQGFEHDEVVDPTAGHRWIEAAPEAITAWFETHP